MNRYFIKLDGVADVPMCSICLENFEEDDRVKTMCKNDHKFHKICIDDWINHYGISCPDCNTPLIVSGILWEVPFDEPSTTYIDHFHLPQCGMEGDETANQPAGGKAVVNRRSARIASSRSSSSSVSVAGRINGEVEG